MKAREELLIIARVKDGAVAEFTVERDNACLLNTKGMVAAAYGRILEVGIAREMLSSCGAGSQGGAEALGGGAAGQGLRTLEIGVALWHGGLPVDVLPAEGAFAIPAPLTPLLALHTKIGGEGGYLKG